MAKYQLTLFVTGDTARSHLAIENIRRLCQKHLPGAYELSVVDVIESPQEAERHRIMATPTLLKTLPLPSSRIIGDLSATDRVLETLGVPVELEPTKSGGNQGKTR